MSLCSPSRRYQFGNSTKHTIQLLNCVTCLIHFHGTLSLCSQNYQMIALGLVVTAGLRGSLEHWRASGIACEKLTSLPESTKKACCSASEGCHGLWALWELGCVSVATRCLFFHHPTWWEAAERDGTARWGEGRVLSINRANSYLHYSQGLCESNVIWKPFVKLS